MRPADTVLPILFYLSIFFLIRKVLIFIFHAYTRTNVTIRGDIQSFASQKSPLTPESCSYGLRSKCAFLTREK